MHAIHYRHRVSQVPHSDAVELGRAFLQTKACLMCGRANDPGSSKKVFTCDVEDGCGYTVDRDEKAALTLALKHYKC